MNVSIEKWMFYYDEFISYRLSTNKLYIFISLKLFCGNQQIIFDVSFGLLSILLLAAAFVIWWCANPHLKAADVIEKERNAIKYVYHKKNDCCTEWSKLVVVHHFLNTPYLSNNRHG